MSWFKKILFYIILILTFAVSFSSEDAKIYIDRKTEPAKLKIGVTKLKTKDLNLDFNAEEKTIFGYLPDSVTDNHLIFVSETLDEMPSLSTTNGRRSINNIKKYLTKNIKVAPKFTYQVLVGDKENGVEEGKRYLLMNCKTVLSGVYVYVVEKDTYHVKEVYKGKFNVPTTLEEAATENYGEIKFFSTHSLRDGDRITSTDGKNIVVVRGGQSIPQDNTIAKLNGGFFPKKYMPPTIGGLVWSGTKKVVIKLGTGVVIEKEFDREAETFDITVNSKLEKASLNESIRFYTTDNSEYLNIQLINWQKFSSLDTSVTIEYYRKPLLVTDKYDLLKIDKFSLNIEAQKNVLEETKGIIAINENHKFNSTEKILTYDGTSLVIENDKNIEYAKLTSQYPKRNIFNRDDVYVQIIHNDVILLAKDGLKVSKDGEFESGEIKLKRATNSNVEIGSMKIESKTDSEYLKFYIRMDKRFRDDTNNNIKLRYLVKDKDYGYFTILKTDEIQINIAPNKEELEENTRGGIFVYSSGGLNTDKITTQSGNNVYVIPRSSEDETIFNGEGASILGEFPKKIIIDKEKADWGDAQQIRITNESENQGEKGEFIISIKENGTFSTGFTDDNDNTPMLSTEKDHSTAGAGKNKDVNIGIKAESNYDYLIIGIYDYNLRATTVLNKTMKLEYQALIENNWVTKRTDRLKVVIQTQNLGRLKPEINIDGPPVWYDYNTSGSDVGVRAFRKVELLNDTATTMSHWESEFIKNTTLNGKNWIDVKNIPEYTYFYRHRIEINGGNGEVIKWTDANGKTQSSSFINIGNGNQIMVAYDGNSDKSLSFGLSKYNFDGGTGTVFIAHYGTKDELLNIQGYDIKIAKFNGLDYVDNTKEIQTSSDYIKEYCFEQEINTNPVEIEYGTVGLRDLDTRITEKFGGEGIEIRATNEVTLVGEGEFSNYRIPALLYFKKETTPIYHEDSYKGQKYTILKGANEKALEGQLYLWVPSQEYLIPKGRFKIVERNNENASPLRVGVVVNNNKEKHFKEITDLYLNITTQRFVTTDIIFKNPIPEPEALKGSWIYLNKKDYPNGTPIPSYIGESWGRVQGEVIDIPVDKVNSVENLVLEVYGENYDKTTPLIEDLTGKELPISMGKNTITISYDSGKTYLRFKTSYPYTLGEEGSFYIRYRNKETGNYLFTQKYNVYYEDKNELRGDTTIHFKNPMMLGKYSSGSTGVIGGSSNLIYIDRSKNSLGKVDGNGNHNTKQDSQQWWEIKKAIDYPNIIKKEGIDYYYYDIFEDSLCERPLYPSDAKYNIGNFEFYIIFNQEKENNYSTLGIGIANLKNGYNGEKLEKEIYIRWRIGGRDGETLKKIDRVKIVVDNFDPTYYGKVFPSEIDDTSPNNYKKINYVGEGYEYLDKTKTDEYIYIDLGTSYRDYMRYKGIMNSTVLNNKGEFKVKTLGSVEVKKANSLNDETILGELLFTKENESNKMELNINPANDDTEPLIPEIYSLKLKLLNSEYQKLENGTKYEIFENSNKDVIEIGYEGQTNQNLYSKLELDKPLNFSTSAPPFIIETNILDFGKINILQNNGTPIEESATTLVKVIGENIDNVELNLEGNENENGDIITYIYLNSSEGIEIKEEFLKVTNIKLETKKENSNKKRVTQNKKEEIKNYDLSGKLTVPLDSKVGEYTGVIYINATIK